MSSTWHKRLVEENVFIGYRFIQLGQFRFGEVGAGGVHGRWQRVRCLPWRGQLGDGLDVWRSLATGSASPRAEIIHEAHNTTENGSAESPISTDSAECTAEDEEENREVALLGRFGYRKRKVITKTLQGNIFVADLDSKRREDKDSSAPLHKSGGRKDRVVVIKKTSKKLHSEHVTVQNGRKFGIYENILKECIILKHLTEN